MLNFQPVSGNNEAAVADDAPMLVDKFFSTPIFGAGYVVLRPGAEKGRQHVRSDAMVRFDKKF